MGELIDIGDLLSDEDIRECDNFLDKNMVKQANQKMKNYYIAYIDLLGMQGKMASESDESFCSFANELAGIVDSIINEVDSRNSLLKKAKIEFHMFSDNMIFLCEDFENLFDYIALLQRRIIIQLEVLMSGIIDYGSIYYYKSRFVLGRGLVSAYEADSSYHHPAIKIGRNIVPKLLDNKAIKKVGYDELIVDYLSHSSRYDIYDFEIELKIHRQFIEQNLEKYKKNHKIYSKYMWLKEYHNSVCENTNMTKYKIR